MELNKGLVDYGYLVYLDLYDELKHFDSDCQELMDARKMNGWYHAGDMQRQDVQGHTVLWFRFERNLDAALSVA